MAAPHRRGAARERQAADGLGSRRVHRGRFERAPDVVPLRLADGTVVVAEAKTHRAGPPRSKAWRLATPEERRKIVGHLATAVELEKDEPPRFTWRGAPELL